MFSRISVIGNILLCVIAIIAGSIFTLEDPDSSVDFFAMALAAIFCVFAVMILFDIICIKLESRNKHRSLISKWERMTWIVFLILHVAASILVAIVFWESSASMWTDTGSLAKQLTDTRFLLYDIGAILLLVTSFANGIYFIRELRLNNKFRWNELNSFGDNIK